jgi:hypothetical protein
VNSGTQRQFANYEEHQPWVKPDPKCKSQERAVQPTERKLPRPDFSFQVGDTFYSAIRVHALEKVPADPWLIGLDPSYVISHRFNVARFIKEHRLHGLLLQAIQPLNDAFTSQRIKVLSLVCDDEGFETLFCLVMITGNMEQARQALQRFDQNWWLSRSNIAAGRLNFDFELI